MKGRHWTIAEVNKLKKAYPTKTAEELVEMFPRHNSIGAIKQAAYKHGAPRKPKPESKYLRWARREHIPSFHFGD